MSPTNGTSNPGNTGSASSTSGTMPSSLTGSTDPLANESTFLSLLVSQLRYQDPLNPVDSTEFITQLTGYSQLEQLIGIHQNTQALTGTDTTTTTSSGSGGTSPSTGQTTGV